jgi:dTDP-4-dehydrorhamnose reductase
VIALVTGMNGTVAPALASRLSEKGHTVIAWDRSAVPVDNPAAAYAFVRATRPDWFFHLATGRPEWAALAARVCADEDIKFLFTSSVSVYSAKQQGPFTVDIEPQPEDDYGRYKLDCEHRVRAANAEALIVRLGWQIGETLTGNQMVATLEQINTADGRVRAGTNWYPACSFLPDTAQSLTSSMSRLPAGLYHLDGNTGLSFYDIAVRLNRLWNERWTIEPTSTPVQDYRLEDARIELQPISDRLR